MTEIEVDPNQDTGINWVSNRARETRRDALHIAMNLKYPVTRNAKDIIADAREIEEYIKGETDAQ